MHGTVVMGPERSIPRQPPPERYRLTVAQIRRASRAEAIALGPFDGLLQINKQFKRLGYEFIRLERLEEPPRFGSKEQQLRRAALEEGYTIGAGVPDSCVSENKE